MNDKLSSRLEAHRKKPYVDLIIEPTVRCPSLCKFCARKSMAKTERLDIDDETFDKIISDISSDRKSRMIRQVILGGWGEPLIHPKIFQYISRLTKELHVPVKININPTLLAEQLLDQLLDSEIRYIVYSLNAPDSYTFDRLMIENRFYDSLSKLEYLLSNRNNKGRKDIEIMIQCMNPWRRKEDERLVQIKKLLKENHDRFYYRGVENISGFMSVKECDTEKNINNVPCFYLWNNLTVDCDGGIYFCCAASLIYRKEADLYMGNIGDKDLSEFMTDTYRKPLQNAQLNNKIQTFKECANCSTPSNL